LLEFGPVKAENISFNSPSSSSSSSSRSSDVSREGGVGARAGSGEGGVVLKHTRKSNAIECLPEGLRAMVGPFILQRPDKALLSNVAKGKR
jgi:hypothetical protein